MKYLLLTIIIVLGLVLGSTEAIAARFDWSLGQPVITVDATESCQNFTKWTFVYGTAAIAYDATGASCVVPVANTGLPIITVKGSTIIKGNTIFK